MSAPLALPSHCSLVPALACLPVPSGRHAAAEWLFLKHRFEEILFLLQILQWLHLASDSLV